MRAVPAETEGVTGVGTRVPRDDDGFAVMKIAQYMDASAADTTLGDLGRGAQNQGGTWPRKWGIPNTQLPRIFPPNGGIQPV